MKPKILLAFIIAIGNIYFTNAQSPMTATESTGAFIRNDGQLKDLSGSLRPDILFYGNFGDKKTYFAKDKASYVWFKPGDTATSSPDTLGRMDMEFVNSNTSAQIIAAEQEQGYLNFFLGHIPNGVVNVPTYEKITYNNLYANTDMQVVKREGKVEYEVTFHPGANANTFKLKFTGSTNIEVLPDGSLKADNHIGKTEFEKPIGKKKVGNQYTPVNVTLNKIGTNEITITITNYQTNKEFVVGLNEKKLPPVSTKPILKGKSHNVRWSTYYGGSANSMYPEEVRRVTIDNAGNIYMTGNTPSSDFPVGSGVQTTYYGVGLDAFVVKFDNFRKRSWATFYGGSSFDISNGIEVDAQSNVYFTGTTESTDFPTWDVSGTTDYYQPAGSNDAYLVIINSSGNQQIWATHFGGNGGGEHGINLVLSANSIYLVGYTYNSQIPFPTSSTGYIQTSIGGLNDGFIARFDKTTFSHQWSTYFGGSSYDLIFDCAIDNANNLIVAGLTSSTVTSATCAPVAGTFPLCNPGGSAYVAGNQGGTDAFIAKFNASNTLTWSTQFGGWGYEGFNNVPEWHLRVSVVTDANGSIYIATSSQSSNIPVLFETPDDYYQYFNGGIDGLLVKFLNTGERVYATYYGGSGDDFINDIAIDSKGDIYFTGETFSSDFPKKNRGLSYNQAQINQTGTTGNSDGFIVWLDKDRKRLWSTYFGGAGNDMGNGIAANTGVNALAVAGTTKSSQQFPLMDLAGTVDYYDGTFNGNDDSFITDFYIGCNPCARMSANQDETEDEKISYSEKNGIVLFPNPAKSVVYVDLPAETTGNSTVTVYNSSGMAVYNKGYSGSSIPVELNGLAKGLYFFQVSSNNETIIQKIIIE